MGYRSKEKIQNTTTDGGGDQEDNTHCTMVALCLYSLHKHHYRTSSINGYEGI